MSSNLHPAVEKTKRWLEEIVIGLNFCPFAKKEFVNNTIHYHASKHGMIEQALHELAEQMQFLIEHPEIETSLVVYATGFRDFGRYLDLVDYANDLLVSLELEGEIQIASFHPDYIFEGESEQSPSNYTNRSPFPTIHLIREPSMEKVLAVYKNPEQIPQDNIELAHEKGVKFFKQFLASVHKM
ncbi:DUF1415 domain-containing protein [Thalassotalea sp. M1531]|uniref:DUF1415 domain-containing protein n=1 Tax=Thalassotalea algicola TaxID=2716224 RepID=A0A7Y0Q7W9_9GAMM|nr:DUF1415 domain-containing protein [Thalassotalea algicola]NMP31460.1 DUF1415 domain-containing protein [Thalassotalea algicola]